MEKRGKKKGKYLDKPPEKRPQKWRSAAIYREKTAKIAKMLSRSSSTRYIDEQIYLPQKAAIECQSTANRLALYARKKGILTFENGPVFRRKNGLLEKKVAKMTTKS